MTPRFRSGPSCGNAIALSSGATAIEGGARAGLPDTDRCLAGLRNRDAPLGIEGLPCSSMTHEKPDRPYPGLVRKCSVPGTIQGEDSSKRLLESQHGRSILRPYRLPPATYPALLRLRRWNRPWVEIGSTSSQDLARTACLHVPPFDETGTSDHPFLRRPGSIRRSLRASSSLIGTTGSPGSLRYPDSDLSQVSLPGVSSLKRTLVLPWLRWKRRSGPL